MTPCYIFPQIGLLKWQNKFSIRKMLNGLFSCLHLFILCFLRYFIFQDPRFWYDLRFTAMNVGSAVSVELVLGLVLAFLVSRNFTGKITLPLITPMIITIVLIRAIDAFKLFELVFGITGAGPGGATESLSFYIYQIGMKWFKLGRGSAVSWIFVLILIGLAMVLISRFRKERT